MSVFACNLKNVFVVSHLVDTLILLQQNQITNKYVFQQGHKSYDLWPCFRFSVSVFGDSKKMNKQLLHVRFNADLARKTKAMAALRGQSITQFVEATVRESLERVEIALKPRLQGEAVQHEHATPA